MSRDPNLNQPLHPFLRAALALSPLRPAAWMQSSLNIDNRITRRWLQGEEMPPEGIFRMTLQLIDQRMVELRACRAQVESLLKSDTLRKSAPVDPARIVPREIADPNPRPDWQRERQQRIERAAAEHRKRLDLEGEDGF